MSSSPVRNSVKPNFTYTSSNTNGFNSQVQNQQYRPSQAPRQSNYTTTRETYNSVNGENDFLKKIS